MKTPIRLISIILIITSLVIYTYTYLRFSSLKIYEAVPLSDSIFLFFKQNNINSTPNPVPSPTLHPTSIPKPTPSTAKSPPTPTPDTSQTYACDPSGQCNNYTDPKAAGCPTYFYSDNCKNRCSDSSLHCKI